MASLPWGLVHRLHSTRQRDTAGVWLEDVWLYPVACLPSTPLIGDLPLDWWLANASPQAPTVLPPNLVNRVLLERGHTDPFAHPLSVAHSWTVAERTVCETIWSEKLKNIYLLFGLLQEKKIADLCFICYFCCLLENNEPHFLNLE